MEYKQYKAAEEYMLLHTSPTDYEREHIYRVLYNALRIAETEPEAIEKIVILASLLHDIGRTSEDVSSGENHASVGGRMAYDYLMENGYTEKESLHVKSCIETHSRRGVPSPVSLEAKILYDADKLDMLGASGVVRSIQYGLLKGDPVYNLDDHGMPLLGKSKEDRSLFREYNKKLKKLSEKFYTKEGKRLAQKKQKITDQFFETLMKEAKKTYTAGNKLLWKYLDVT